MERASPLGVPVAHLAIGNGSDLCPAVATHRAVCRSPTRGRMGRRFDPTRQPCSSLTGAISMAPARTA